MLGVGSRSIRASIVVFGRAVLLMTLLLIISVVSEGAYLLVMHMLGRASVYTFAFSLGIYTVTVAFVPFAPIGTAWTVGLRRAGPPLAIPAVYRILVFFSVLEPCACLQSSPIDL